MKLYDVIDEVFPICLYDVMRRDTRILTSRACCAEGKKERKEEQLNVLDWLTLKQLHQQNKVLGTKKVQINTLGGAPV